MSRTATLIRRSFTVFLLILAFEAGAQPVVSSFNPVSGPVGTTVTISGAGFNAVPSGNIVYFGAVMAAVTGGSATSLTVTVPAGATYVPLSVLNTATGLTGYSASPFLATFTNPFGTGVPADFFQPPIIIPTDYAPNAVATGDLDGDGKPDLVVSTFGNITVQRNVSATGGINAASFAGKVTLPLSSTNYTNIVVRDVDGDGKPDIVAVSSFNNLVTIWRNASTSGSLTAASFASYISFTMKAAAFAGNSVASLAVGDLDGDGKPELVVAKSNSLGQVFNTVSVFPNTSTPGSINASSFAARVDLTTDNSPNSVVISDVDGDGKPDIITANLDTDNNSSQGSLSVLRNVSVPGSITTTSFAAHVEFAAGNRPDAVAAGDIDGDGKPELIAASSASNTVSVLRNTAVAGSISSSSFTPAASFTAAARFIVLGDADGDAKPDIITNGSGSLGILRNTATTGSINASSFAPVVNFAGGSSNLSIAFGDLDSDGIPEAVVPNLSNMSASVFKVNAPSFAPPRISAFSPASGPVGTTVTITGSGFYPDVPAYNSVFFGAVKAAPVSATTTSLTVTVPAGATLQPLSVVAPSGLAAYASRPFITTFNNPLGTGINAGFYRPKVDFGTGTLPYFAVLNDLDGDGRPDMVVANAADNTISILVNVSVNSLGATSFASKIDIPVGNDPRAIAIGDVDGSALPEIVVANAGSSSLTVLRNSSRPGNITAASFDLRVDFPTGSHPFSVAINDIDLDGRPELISANLSAGTVSVLHNTGVNGTIYPTSFASRTDYAAGAFPRSIVVNDLDGDGRPDIAVVNEQSNTVSILRNVAITGTIDLNSLALVPGNGFATGNNPNCIITSDIDSDGRPDLVVSNWGSNSVSVFRNSSSLGVLTPGSFAPKRDFATAGQPFFVAAGDADGDGKPDIITANASSNNLSVLRNTTTVLDITASSFAPKVDFAVGNYPVSAAVGDLDGNGIPELIAANAASNTVSVLAINLPQPPVITSFNPASGPAGTTVTITGTGFNATPANNIVYFGAVRAAVSASSATSLTVKVPAGATYQPLSVLNSASGLTAFASRPFNPTFPNPFGTGIPADYFKPKVDFSTGNNTFLYGIAFGDLDGDGKPDMVGVNRIAQTITVLRNISSTGTITASSFAAPLVISTPNYPESVVLTDIDGDGKLDIVTANPGSYSFSVLRNIASPGALTAASFAARVDISTGVYISSLAAGDLDRDGKTDIVVTNLYSGTVSVFRNITATGVVNASSFAGKVDYPAGDFPRFVVIRDVNNDAKPELIVANEKSNNVSVLNNAASPGFIIPASFNTKVDYAAGSSPSGVAVGDLDEDGKPEIVVCNYGSNTVSVLRNTSSFGTLTAGSFAAKIDFGTGTRPFFVALGDADGDSLVDLVTANSGSNNVSVLRNAGSINTITGQSFVPKVDFGTGGYPLWVVLGDLDGDGIAELATANASNATISVLKVANPPQVATLAAATGLQAAAEAAAGTMQLYPNPTPGDFTLQLQGIKGSVANVEVFGENGRLIERRVLNPGSKAARSILSLSLRSQPAGVYYVKVTGIDGVQVTKVIVQR